MSSLQSYLASKYLTADPKSTKKKRKRKDKDAAAGLVIADDDDLLGLSRTAAEDDGDPNDLKDGQPAPTGKFRAKQTSGWKTVGAPAPSDAEQAAADAIIASAAAENAAATGADDAPTILDDPADPAAVTLSDGTHAGLQTAAAVAAQQAAHKQRELARWERASKAAGPPAEDTVYRDATGRRIDISMRRAQIRAEQDEAERKQKAAVEALKGDVQRAAAVQRRADLDAARFLTVARHADDEDMNRELKEVERWNDPAAMFLTKKKDKGVTRRAGEDDADADKNPAMRKSAFPPYQGAAPPNRYGIRPGHRWDGVDRGNGWEGERFKAWNRRERNRGLEYAWQMDE